MHFLTLLMTLFSTAIVARTFAPAETGMPEAADKNCDKACYNPFRYLMGDYHTHEDWLDHTTSYPSCADQVCAAHLCSDCPFCLVSQNNHDTTLNFNINLDSRRDPNHDNIVGCLDCQKYVDACQISLREGASNDRDDVDCELKLCSGGPIHCHARGQCERRICKDLVMRT